MAEELLTVRHLPDPVLSRPAAVVDPADPAVLRLAEAMVNLMRASPRCVGVAAPQVGEGVRLFVLDVTGHQAAKSQSGLVVLANPTIVERSGKKVSREGCLSVPDLTGDVPRSTKIVVSGVEPGSGLKRTVQADAFEARALQHELDHLDGLLFVDRVTTPEGIYSRRSYG